MQEDDRETQNIHDDMQIDHKDMQDKYKETKMSTERRKRTTTEDHKKTQNIHNEIQGELQRDAWQQTRPTWVAKWTTRRPFIAEMT